MQGVLREEYMISSIRIEAINSEVGNLNRELWEWYCRYNPTMKTLTTYCKPYLLFSDSEEVSVQPIMHHNCRRNIPDEPTAIIGRREGGKFALKINTGKKTLSLNANIKFILFCAVVHAMLLYSSSAWIVSLVNLRQVPVSVMA